MENRLNKEFFYAAGIRALKTFFQVLASTLVVGMTLTDIDWITVLSTAALAAILSLCTSFSGGLPEAGTTQGTVIVVEESEEKPSLLLELDDEKAIEALKNKKQVLFKTSTVNVDEFGKKREG